MKYLTNLDLSRNELQNAVIQPLSGPPSKAKAGQIYYNSSDNLIYRYTGSQWGPVGVVYNQNSTTGAVITGLNENGQVTVTNVTDLTLTGYSPVESGYITEGMTFQQALSALDAAVKNAVAGGGEVNQNAWSYVLIPAQSTNNSTEVTESESPNTISATSPTDTFTIQSGDEWIITTGNSGNKTITLGHKFSGVTASQYGDATTVPQITVDNAGHITNVANQTIVGAEYITRLTSDAQTQLNNMIPLSQKGAKNGVATLGSDGLIPNTQLPSYVDDVVETYVVGDTPLASDWLSTTQGGDPLTPQKGIIYMVVGEGEYQNDQYRWGGTKYVLCNPSDVNSVNGKTGIVVLTQDDVLPGTTYTQFSLTDQSKLNNIQANATANTITLNGSENANPSFYAPTTAGSSGQVLLSSGTGAPTWGAMPQAFTKYVAQNIQLSGSGGSFIWVIPSSEHNINNAGIIVQVYEVATGNQVIADVSVNQSNYTITITINDTEGTNTLSPNTYQVVAFG